MKCDYDYCIYNRGLTCIFDEIQINSLGMCEICEVVSISKEDLEEYKRRRLIEIEEIWKD